MSSRLVEPQRSRNAFATALGCLVILFLGGGIIGLLFVAVRLLRGASVSVPLGVLPVAGTALGAVLLAFFNHQLQRQRELDERVRPRKVEIYEEFISLNDRQIPHPSVT